MSSRFSPPPLKPYHADYVPRKSSAFGRHTRLLYVAIALVLLYLWHRSNVSIIPRHHLNHEPSLNYKNVDWSRYAYSLYATDGAYLCNAVMVFEALSRLGSRADRILFYPDEWDLEIAGARDRDSQLLLKARDEYKVKLVPVEMPQELGDAWHGSFAKFYAWSQTDYERILHLDSDVTVLKHMDDLFMLPAAQVAMMRAYWELPKKKELTSLFILLQPSDEEWQRLTAASRADNRPAGDYDMEILNRFYGDSAMVLPHRQYGLLTGEFRSTDHSNYIGSFFEKWDADRIYREASLVHFSDWPLPKPWIMWPHKLIGEILPKCYSSRGLEIQNCREKEIWLSLYDDFRKRRKEVCALLSSPAPEWPPRNGTSTKKSDSTT